MARSYKRDSKGRFAGGGGGGGGGGRKGGSPRPGQIERGVQRAKANRKRGELQGMYGGFKSPHNPGKTIYKAQDALKTYASAKSGGGRKGGASKGGSTTAANNATTKRLQKAGLTGIGSRLKGKNASLYQGKAATRKGRAQLWANAEHNQKVGKDGAQFSAAKPKGMVRGRRKG